MRKLRPDDVFRTNNLCRKNQKSHKLTLFIKLLPCQRLEVNSEVKLNDSGETFGQDDGEDVEGVTEIARTYLRGLSL